MHLRHLMLLDFLQRQKPDFLFENFWSLQGPSIFSLFCRLFLVLICIPFAFVG